MQDKKSLLAVGLCILNITTTVFTEAKASTFDYMGAAPLNRNQGNGQVSLQDDFLAASVTFDSAVTPGFTGVVGASDVLSWTMDIGSYSFSSSSPDFLPYVVQFTFDNGVVQQANFLILGGGYWGPGIPYYNIGTIGTEGYDIACIGAVFNNCMLSSGVGEWTEVSAAVPVSATLWLLISALPGFIGFNRRKTIQQ